MIAFLEIDCGEGNLGALHGAEFGPEGKPDIRPCLSTLWLCAEDQDNVSNRSQVGAANLSHR